MKINGLMGVDSAYYATRKNSNKVSTCKQEKIVNFDINNIRPRNYSRVLSFTSNPAKNTSQVASIAPEYQGILDELYKKGGLGNVAGEASVAFQDKGNMDFRSFVPYYSYGNEEGGVQVKYPKLNNNGEQLTRTYKKTDSLGNIIEIKEPDFGFKSVPVNYKLKENEEFVIRKAITDTAPLSKQYTVIEPTSIKGTVTSISKNMKDKKTTPYTLFKVKGTGSNIKGKPTTYLVHTPDIAKFEVAYNSVGAYSGNVFDDALYSTFSKATVDALPQMNTEEFGYYNPGNFWLHDRQAFPALVEISEKSSMGDEYWRGIKAHSTYHNPGRDYQGHYKSPLDFMQIAGNENDLKKLESNPKDYLFVTEMAEKIEQTRKKGTKFSPEKILTEDEMKELNRIFKPLFGDFIDETGEYNLCKIPINGVRKNPYNFTLGTVSKYYGKEMRNPSTNEVAYGLSRDLASLRTIDIVNGSSAVNLHLDEIGKFGRGTDFSDDVKAGFTPLTKEIAENTESLFNAKQANKKWLINSISDTLAKGKEQALATLFSPSDVKNGASILGNFSNYKDGDVLFISWGRPDPQKGFPTTLEGFLSFLKDETVSQEAKDHTKLLAGAGPWSDNASDWKLIQEKMKEIQTIDDGRYKDNFCYLNGFFSNRIVACADYSNITSRFEPCGITPLESFAGGTPVISNNTGGSPDFITPFVKNAPITTQNGFLTEHAFLVNPEVIGAQKELSGQALDEARIAKLGEENANCIKQAVELFSNDKEGYKKMMSNAKNAKIDWHENLKYNAGKSAIDCYKEGAWGLTPLNKEIKGFERYTGILENLKGQIAKSTISNKTIGAITFAGIAGLTIGAIAVKKTKNQANKKLNNIA